MSLHEYQAAQTLWQADVPFYALIMAAMYRADTDNAARLQAAFPDTWTELQARYNAGGGRIPGDPDYEQVQADRAALGMMPT